MLKKMETLFYMHRTTNKISTLSRATYLTKTISKLRRYVFNCAALLFLKFYLAVCTAIHDKWLKNNKEIILYRPPAGLGRETEKYLTGLKATKKYCILFPGHN